MAVVSINTEWIQYLTCHSDFVTAGFSNVGDKTTTARFKGLTSNHYMKGLLETEPLHFTCHAASDGTKMEKIEPGLTLLSVFMKQVVCHVTEQFHF
jgi:hypothetical protein